MTPPRGSPPVDDQRAGSTTLHAVRYQPVPSERCVKSSPWPLSTGTFVVRRSPTRAAPHMKRPATTPCTWPSTSTLTAEKRHGAPCTATSGRSRRSLAPPPTTAASDSSSRFESGMSEQTHATPGPRERERQATRCTKSVSDFDQERVALPAAGADRREPEPPRRSVAGRAPSSPRSARRRRRSDGRERRHPR